MPEVNQHLPSAAASESLASATRVRIDVPGVLDDCCEPFATAHYYAAVTDSSSGEANCANPDCVNGEITVDQDGTDDGVWFAPAPCPDCEGLTPDAPSDECSCGCNPHHLYPAGACIGCGCPVDPELCESQPNETTL